MRRITYLLLLTILCVSCSESNSIPNLDDNDGDDDPEIPKEIVVIKLTAEQSSGNIFEPMGFQISPSRNTDLYEIKETYDSLVWVVPNVGSLNLTPTNQFSFKWSHNFTLPGEYKTKLLGYKDDKIIMRDSVSIAVNNKKNFLDYNWADVTTRPNMGHGYHNVFSKTTFTSLPSLENGVKAIELYLMYDNSGDENIFYEKSQYILRDLMTSLYSEPEYGQENIQLLTEKYNALFKVSKESTEPLNIWITSTTRIVLLKYQMDPNSNYQYLIHAEQNVD